MAPLPPPALAPWQGITRLPAMHSTALVGLRLFLLLLSFGLSCRLMHRARGALPPPVPHWVISRCRPCHVVEKRHGLLRMGRHNLAGLTGLLRVNLSHNSFSGGLPPELMYSRSIVVLDVSFSRLSGVLHEPPSSVTTTLTLQVLNISSNQFGAEFPSYTWKLMRNLVVLNASNNSFTGHIPPSLCLSSSLAMLDLCRGSRR